MDQAAVQCKINSPASPSETTLIAFVNLCVSLDAKDQKANMQNIRHEGERKHVASGHRRQIQPKSLAKSAGSWTNQLRVEDLLPENHPCQIEDLPGSTH